MKSLALNILDIVQNSIRAQATEIRISIIESEANDSLLLSVTDNGTGISHDLIGTVTDPFVTTRKTRRTGLGLPLLKQHAEMAGGNFLLASEPGQGTSVTASFIRSHPDRQPAGDIPGVMRILLATNPGIDFALTVTSEGGSYSFSTAEVKQVLEIDRISDMSLINDITAMITENLLTINVSDTANMDLSHYNSIK